jgi:hypothetical protein
MVLYCTIFHTSIYERRLRAGENESQRIGMHDLFCISVARRLNSSRADKERVPFFVLRMYAAMRPGLDCPFREGMWARFGFLYFPSVPSNSEKWCMMQQPRNLLSLQKDRIR